MNAQHVIRSQHNYEPFDIDTPYGTVTLQRTGLFSYRASMGPTIGYIMVNGHPEATIYTAHDLHITSWHRDTLEECAEMLALRHAGGGERMEQALRDMLARVQETQNGALLIPANTLGDDLPITHPLWRHALDAWDALEALDRVLRGMLDDITEGK